MGISITNFPSVTGLEEYTNRCEKTAQRYFGSGYVMVE